MAAARLKTDMTLLCSPTASVQKKAWMDMPACNTKGFQSMPSLPYFPCLARALSSCWCSVVGPWNQSECGLSLWSISTLRLPSVFFLGPAAKEISYQWSWECPIRTLSRNMMRMRVTIAMIIVRGSFPLCRMPPSYTRGDEERNQSKLVMAYGMTSMSAMERKSVPENVMARSMTVRLLKQSREETQLPKTVTQRKKTTMSTTFTAHTPYIRLLQQAT